MCRSGTVKRRTLPRTRRLATHSAFPSSASFLYSFHPILNITELGMCHTKNQTFGFCARLWVITCWDQSSKHPSLDTQASCATCKQDKTHFHSLLTGGNVASNREGVAFIIRGPDTDEVLGKGGQRPQDGGCCSARNLNLQKRRRRSWERSVEAAAEGTRLTTASKTPVLELKSCQQTAP